MGWTSKKRLLIAIGFLLVAIAVLSLAAGLIGGRPWIAPVAKALAVGAGLGLLLWLVARLLRAFLWRVGRRLAVSYFLIGVLPIPMVTLLGLLVAYLMSGYFLGHLYRDAVVGVESDLRHDAASRLEEVAGGPPGERLATDRVYAVYREGRRVAGDPRLPAEWPLALEARQLREAEDGRAAAHFVALPDGEPTLAWAERRGNLGVVSLYSGDLEREIGERTGLGVAFFRSDDPDKEGSFRLQLFGRRFALQPLLARKRFEAHSDAESATSQTATSETATSETTTSETTTSEMATSETAPGEAEPAPDPPWSERPLLFWGEISGPLLALDTGEMVAEYVSAALNGSPSTVSRHLLSGSAEVDTTIWVAVISATVLLATLYGVAVLMATSMIFTLSRAVNHLSRSTDAVRRGDFSVRIPVRRADQVGELHQSFNQMIGNLERAMSLAAQKEILENELQIARDLQKSLLPTDLPAIEGVSFSTLFEPSAAIGGDYFDIFRLDDRRLVVIVADVAGHGLPTGLRMAMLKAALMILIEEAPKPGEILRRLSEMIRSSGERRFLVTATAATLDLETGSLEVTNAGHPPTYIVRDGKTEEVLLPGNPLGALGQVYGETTIELVDGDVVVWLSDGLIEATDSSGEPFGYDRLRRALDGRSRTAAEVRDRLLKTLARFTGNRPAEDDKTLVAMRYRAPAGDGAARKPATRST